VMLKLGGEPMSTKLAIVLMLTSLAVGQDDRIKLFISVTCDPANALIMQLGEDLKQEFIASKKYELVSSQAEADVHFAIIGVEAESQEVAATSALVCLHPSGTNSALYHTVSLVGLKQTSSLAHTWLLDSDKQIGRYLPMLRPR
jgi:hypothetical protein